MRGRGLKFDLTITMAFLLITGMLLTDFVIMGLWQYHVNHARREKLTQSLALTVAGIQDAASPTLTPGDHVRTELEKQGLCLHLVPVDKNANPPLHSCSLNGNVTAVLETVLREQQPVVRQVDRQGQSQWLGQKWLVVARPLYQGKTLIGAVGLAGPMTTFFDLVSANQQQVLVYILINALILTVVGFFRISRQVIRPLERLINLADNYQAQDMVLFSSQNQSNEISQLSTSLNSVVQRIEHDKGVLKQTVTELAQKNQLLQQNQREMLRAEKLASVGRLAAGLAHEIGNPLGVAQGYLQLLGMGDCLEDERVEYTAKALRELERVDGLIRRLLDYARSGQGDPVRFDVHDALDEIVDDLAVQPLFRTIRFDIVRQAEKSDIYADREQLRQVIVNCVLNAADAIKESANKDAGLIGLATALVSSPDNGQTLLQVSIADNGVGIPDTVLDTVFDPFFTTKQPGAGTGLGLSVSLALVESMGGRMNIQSAPGQGTTVCVLLPLATEDAHGAEKSEAFA